MATLSGIYLWISDNFPYYKTAGNGWKESLFYTVTIRFVRRVFVVNSCKFQKFPQPGLELASASVFLKILASEIHPHEPNCHGVLFWRILSNFISQRKSL